MISCNKQYNNYYHSVITGYKVENVFEETADTYGWSVTRSTRKQDMHEHWDFCMMNDTHGMFLTDVKSKKKLNRYDKDYNYDWTWLELHGVNKNNTGWIYGAKSDLIAFELEHHFMLIEREKIIKVIDEMVDKDSIVEKATEAKYKIYQRNDRYDELTLVETEILKDLAWDHWIKVAR